MHLLSGFVKRLDVLQFRSLTQCHLLHRIHVTAYRVARSPVGHAVSAINRVDNMKVRPPFVLFLGSVWRTHDKCCLQKELEDSVNTPTSRVVPAANAVATLPFLMTGTPSLAPRDHVQAVFDPDQADVRPTSRSPLVGNLIPVDSGSPDESSSERWIRFFGTRARLRQFDASTVSTWRSVKFFDTLLVSSQSVPKTCNTLGSAVLGSWSIRVGHWQVCPFLMLGRDACPVGTFFLYLDTESRRLVRIECSSQAR